ncbi:MAG: ABC transporter substrate-binding protein [Chloroflexota bacterium]
MTAFARTHRLVTGVLLAVLVIGCGGSVASPTASGTESSGNNPPTSEAAFPRTLSDDAGDVVTISTAPTSIVALTPASVEMLAALGLADHVVGIAECSCTPDALKSIPTVASYSGVDTEAIVALQPDLVFVAAPPFTPEDAINALRAAQLTIVTLNPTSIMSAMSTMQLIGDAVGATLPAADLVANMESEITALVSLVDPEKTPSVFYEVDATAAIYGLAPDDYAAELITLAGGTPVTSGSPGVYEISLEALIAAAPEVILLGDAAYGVTPEAVAARPGWSSIPAVKSGAIRGVDGDLITTPGPRLASALAALIQAINPAITLP